MAALLARRVVALVYYSPMTQSTAPAERIQSLDALRGVAVLGILLVNVQGFARVSAAYLNPAAGRALDLADLWTWIAVYVLADTKFISVFSLLFGAGIAIMSDRMSARGVSAAGIHYRRQLWLLVAGLAHAFLLWHGDILVAYALLGFALYPLRNLAPRKLLWIGGMTVAVSAALLALAALSLPFMTEADRALLVAEWAPPQEEIDAETAALRGSWTAQLPQRASLFANAFAYLFPTYFVWRAGGLMIVGMALVRTGFLTASRSAAFYRRVAVAGLVAGLPICGWGASLATRAGLGGPEAMIGGQLLNYVGSVGVFLGYVALVMLWMKGAWMPGLQRRLAATGRMALTNYLAQSLVCTWVFYGHGLGLFERVSAPGQIGIAVAVCALQLLWSPWWLARYRYGPLEWLWRSATYGRLVPMRAPN